MGGSFPNLRHNGHFLELLLKNNNEFKAYHDVTTTPHPVLLHSSEEVNHSFAGHSNGFGNGTLKREFDSFYFYKAEQFTVLWVLFTMIVLGNSAVLIALLVSKGRKSRMNFFIKQLAIAGKRARMLIVLAWMFSIIFSLPVIFLFEETPIEDVPQCWIDLKQQWQWQVYMTSVAVALFVIPALIISACYTVIVWTIWTKSKLLIPMGHIPIRQIILSGEDLRDIPPRHLPDDHDYRRASSRGIIPRAKIKTVKMTFVIVFMFIVCWSPFIIFDLLQVYGHIPKTQTTIAIATLIQSLAPLNSAANPIIYCLFSTHMCGNLRCGKILKHLNFNPCRKIPPFTWLSKCISICIPSSCFGHDNASAFTTTTTSSSRRSTSATSLRHTIRVQPPLQNGHKVAISIV
ncbi:cardioacceleratory peptide receptor-like isoform X3 [Diabrotica undecimpunctata]|uniref:cardioacceleratory peptide receptor-like isoform X3 n=1 Tax=Diabrotica undecimpunctata TaxID=50387 RepID=UPI003B63FD41